MGVKTKGRRKITVGDRQFVWYVTDDYDSVGYALYVISQDKAFIVNYHLGQLDQTRFLAVLGREFPGLPEAGGVWIRVLCPQWEDDNGAMTPAGVRRLIEWCLLSERELVQVDYRGQRSLGEERAVGYLGRREVMAPLKSGAVREKSASPRMMKSA